MQSRSKPMPVVNVLLGQFFQGSVGLSVEFHKNQVPDLDDFRMILVYEFFAGNGSFLFFRAYVHVDFAAGATGSLGSHFPEIVLLVSPQDSFLWQVLRPEIKGLLVKGGAVLFITLKNSYIETVLIDRENLGKQFPRPSRSPPL